MSNPAADCPPPAITPAGYPASTKRAAGLVKDVLTDAMVVGFADKLLITITQDGRLAQWVRYRSSVHPAAFQR